MSRIRTLDSKISFFAFADIITAVSGMLIFITLLLATDLGRPTNRRASAADRATAAQLEDALRQQLQMDGQIRRLQELLAAAETAPSPEKIEGDMARLRSDLTAEQRKQSALSEQMSQSAASLQARDRALGLTDLKFTLERATSDANAIALQETKTRKRMDDLEEQAVTAQSRLAKLSERDGKLWIIPERSTTSKEPVLVTVGGSDATVQSFDHPEQRKQWDADSAESSFKAYLGSVNSKNQYVLFLIRPSGIKLFQTLVEMARASGFEVGYDALEENAQAYFSTPPPLDEPVRPPVVPATNHFTAAVQPAPVVIPPKTEAAPPPPPAKPLSWWQRFLRWLGLST